MGRPRKEVTEFPKGVIKEVIEPQEEVVTSSRIVRTVQTKEPEKFTFKSKFRRDKITLKKGEKVKNPDGSMSVISPQIYAEFDRNTWVTRDPELAALMRERIKRAEDGYSAPPLNVIETTNL